MALTNEDLSSIAQIINKEFANFKKELDVELDARFAAELSPIREDILQIRDDILQIRDDVSQVRDNVSQVRDDVSQVRDDISQINLTIENVLEPQIRLLAENYVPAAVRYEKAVPQMESMQDDIDMLKKVVAKHSEMLHKLA